MKKVLFVCLGNICRSPTAEGVFKKMVEDEGLSQHFEIDSAGTASYHEGESPDPRTVHHAQARGYHLDSLARGLSPQDLDDFDILLLIPSFIY
ncbi:MAG: low molecular weight phosphotyrosine protein phosphatase, partial [Pseudomonadota bacterium]